MTLHRLHVSGLDGAGVALRLECLDECPPNGCNAHSWLTEAGPDNTVGMFEGPPPWYADVAWISEDDGPQINPMPPPVVIPPHHLEPDTIFLVYHDEGRFGENPPLAFCDTFEIAEQVKANYIAAETARGRDMRYDPIGIEERPRNEPIR